MQQGLSRGPGMPTTTPTLLAQSPAAGAAPAPDRRSIALPSLRRGRAMGSVDFSRPQYRIGGLPLGGSPPTYPTQAVGEFLEALPMIKAEQVVVSIPSNPSSSMLTMTAPIFRMNSSAMSGPPNPAYDNVTGPTSINNVGISADPYPNYFARIGLTFPALALDSEVGARLTAQNLQDVRVATAIRVSMATLDTALAQGTGALASGVQLMRGLQALTGTAQNIGMSRSTLSSIATLQADLINAISTITVSGNGSGEGANCLVGGPFAMRALMGTTAGMSASSGWKVDQRTGLFIYHWLGLPFYRANCSEDSSSGGQMWAANLGPTGLSLAYTSGTPDTYGFQLDELPITETSANRAFTLHGAFALIAWENECAWGLTGIK